MNYVFSDKITSLQPSAIREILKATADPKIIPLAAGNPSSEAFPVEEVRTITAKLLENRAVEALQYNVSEGYKPLRDTVMNWLKQRENIDTKNNDILIVSGATQVMDLVSKVLCNENDTVICEEPSFIGALNTFRSYGCKLAGVPIDDDGMNMDALETTLKTAKNARFIYTIPNFQNPSGCTMSKEKRERLYALAKKYGVLILEDNPYGDLRVSGEKLPSIKSMDKDGIVIYAGSFSKIFSPGLRVAYCICPEPIHAKLTVGKQTTDVHTPILNQMIIDEWFKNYDVNKHIEKICDIYRGKLSLMCECIDRDLGGFAHYIRPDGGLFVWCELPHDIEMLDFCKKAIEKNVAVVPGNAFMVDEKRGSHFIRLNFSTPTNDAICEGISILGDVAKGFSVK